MESISPPIMRVDRSRLAGPLIQRYKQAKLFPRIERVEIYRHNSSSYLQIRYAIQALISASQRVHNVIILQYDI